MTELFTHEAMTALFQVVMIDLVLAGDNAIVIGLAAAGLPKDQRNKAILIGIIAATVLRIGFASVTVQLLEIIGLLLAGGVLLLWVCWKMWRELRTPHVEDIDEVLRSRNQGLQHRAAIAKDPWTGHLADHDRRRVDVARQCSGRRGCRTRAPDDPRVRIGIIHCPDGLRRQFHRETAAKSSLDRLCRPRDHPLCRPRHVATAVRWRFGSTRKA